MPPTPAEPTTTGQPVAEGPAWAEPYDALIRTLSQAFAPITCATPLEAAVQQRALLDRWRAGAEEAPRWSPPPIDRHALSHARAAVDRARSMLGGASAWERIYAARLAELALDLALVDASFSPTVIASAHARWGATDPDADRLAASWAREAANEASPAERVATDDERDPRSLVARLRRDIGAARLGVRVVVRERIGALAASGDGVVVVSRGRTASEREITRVALHELEGHVLPRERARALRPGLACLGSAGAAEDEEGRAIVLEERASLLHAGRRRALGLRHLAARWVLADASFVELVRALTREHGEPLEEALRTAARAMRGGYRKGGDVHGGIGREIIYLPGYLRVRRAARADAALLDRLGSARLSMATRDELGI